MSGLAKLPWETREDGWQPWPGSIQILSDDGEIIAYTTSGANEKINVAFIVKAANNFGALMETLEKIASENTQWDWSDKDTVEMVLGKIAVQMRSLAREALAKAATS